jgi:hypothetical protein
VDDVETILSSIRDRVRADEGRRANSFAPTSDNGDSLGPLPAGDTSSAPEQTESLARLSAHLTATARAWNRLPPVFSNRGGAAGRLELWIKSRLKSLSRWFTWEQVNFNAAVHHSLSETLELLSAQKQELVRLRAELDKATSALDKKEREIQELCVRLDAQSTEMRARRDNEEREIRARLSEIDLRLAELAQNLREEQRVCFKQLALEISETAVLEDRCRRNLESRLEQLESAAISNKAKGTSTS